MNSKNNGNGPYVYSALRRLALTLVVGATCSACALDNTGFLAAKVSRADGALVADIYSLGGQLRTTAADPGFTLGYQRRSYVFSLDESASLESGWYFGHVPLPAEAFVAMDTRSYGLELRAPGPEASLSLGLRATTLLGRFERGHDGALWLSYRPDNPAATRLRTCEGGDQCTELY